MASNLVNDPGEFRCRAGIATYNDLPLTLPRMKGLA